MMTRTLQRDHFTRKFRELIRSTLAVGVDPSDMADWFPHDFNRALIINEEEHRLQRQRDADAARAHAWECKQATSDRLGDAIREAG